MMKHEQEQVRGRGDQSRKLSQSQRKWPPHRTRALCTVFQHPLPPAHLVHLSTALSPHSTAPSRAAHHSTALSGAAHLAHLAHLAYPAFFGARVRA